MVDVTKCLGCRKGIGLFIKEDGEYKHVDLFTSKLVGSVIKCENSKNIEHLLYKNGDKETYLPNQQLESFYNKQEYWYQDIMELAYEIFKDNLIEFFNNKVDGIKMIEKSNNEIENTLLKIAEEKNIEITEEDYPDLIKWGK